MSLRRRYSAIRIPLPVSSCCGSAIRIPASAADFHACGDAGVIAGRLSSNSRKIARWVKHLADGVHWTPERRGGVAVVRTQQVVRYQELREGKRIAMPLLHSVAVIAELIGAKRAQIRKALPDRVFQLGSMFPAHVAVHFEKIHGTPTIAAKREDELLRPDSAWQSNR